MSIGRERVSVTPQLLFHTFGELRDRGVDLACDPNWSCFAPDGFAPGGVRPSFHLCERLIAKAIAVTGDIDLGIAVGRRQTFASLGILGTALSASETLGDAMDLVIRYHATIGSMLDFERIADTGGDARISIRPRFAGSPIWRFLLQEALVTTVTISRHLLPGRSVLKRIETSFLPRDLEAFRRQCGCQLVVETDRNEISIERSALDARLDTADAFALREVTNLLDHLLHLELAERQLIHRVEALIMRRLPRVAAIAEAAGELGMSERNLRRRLADAGTSYRSLLEGIRLETARQQLTEGGRGREEIAFDLGFSDARSLRRLLARPDKSAG